MKKVLLLLFTLITITAFSQKNKQSPNEGDTIVHKLVVGYKITPPFVIKNKGALSGVSIELWETIAQELGYVYEYKEYRSSEIEKLLSDVETGVIDLSINPTTVTSERIKRVDFTQPFYMSSLAVAFTAKESNRAIEFLSNMFSPRFWKAILFLFIILLILGTLIWLIENRNNKNQFRNGIKGIGDGVWWAATTMTTVGYGDLAPKTFIGRILGTIWMFTAIIVISGLTGSIAASLTTKQIKHTINSVADLNKLKVGTIKGSSSEDFLLRNRIQDFDNSFESVKVGLEALAGNKIEAFVYDEPILNYYVASVEKFKDIIVLDKRFSVDYLSFSMQKEHELMKEINQALVYELEKISWLGVLHTYELSK